MDDTSERDQRVLDLLTKEQLVTRAQETRLRAALKRGMRLADAIERVPLVDPVKFASLQSLAAQELQKPLVPHEPVRNETEAADIEIDLQDDSEPIDLPAGRFRIEDRGVVGNTTDENDEEEQASEMETLRMRPAEASGEKQDKHPSEEVTADKDPASRRSSISRMVRTPYYELEVTSPLPGRDASDDQVSKPQEITPASNTDPRARQPEQKTPEDNTPDDTGLDDLEDFDDLDDIDLPDSMKRIDELDDELDLTGVETAADQGSHHEPEHHTDDSIRKPQFDDAPATGAPDAAKKSQFLEDLKAAFQKKEQPPPKSDIEQAVGSLLRDAFAPPEKESAAENTRDKSATTTPFPALDDPNSYNTSSQKVQTYSLLDDEGITLIRQVNQILSQSLDAGDVGILLHPFLPGTNLRRFDCCHNLREAESIEKGLVEKVANRLKVMARIEPWRRQKAQRGMFHAVHGSTTASIYVASDPDGEGNEALYLHIVRG